MSHPPSFPVLNPVHHSRCSNSYFANHKRRKKNKNKNTASYADYFSTHFYRVSTVSFCHYQELQKKKNRISFVLKETALITENKNKPDSSGVRLNENGSLFLTLLHSCFSSPLNSEDCLLFSAGWCLPLGIRTTALNDFTGEPLKTVQYNN